MKILNKNEIDYLIYGSFAKYCYNFDITKCNDLDIIVHQNDLDTINEILNMKFDCFLYEFGLHANSKFYLNDKGKPFDISFDSLEHYF